MIPYIEIKELSIRYSDNGPLVLDSINAYIEKGSITAIAGLSGCGKSTLAFCLSGAIPKSLPGIIYGNILIEGRDIKDIPLPALSQQIGIVFQDVDNQLFLPTVEAEVAFAPENLCLSRERIGTIVSDVLETLGIGHLRHSDPSRLSGGEKHLVAIASILSLDPDIIILDEVMSQLDKEYKELISGIIGKLRSCGKTIIIIDHSIKNLMLADTILLMKQGRLEERIEVEKDHELLYCRLSNFFLSQGK